MPATFGFIDSNLVVESSLDPDQRISFACIPGTVVRPELHSPSAIAATLTRLHPLWAVSLKPCVFP